MRHHAALTCACLLALAAHTWSAGGRRFSLLMGQSARSLALSGAGGSVQAGTDSIFRNWAALSGLERSEAALTHQSWLADTSFETLSYARPLGGEGGGLGMGLSAFRVAPFDNTGGLAPAMEMSTYLVALGGSLLLGRPMQGRLYAGAGLQYLTSYFGEAFSTRDLAASLGLVLQPAWEQLRMGASLRNAGLMTTVGDPLPMEAGMGLALMLTRSQVLGAELVYSQELGTHLQLGWEAELYGVMSARLGLSTRSLPGTPLGLSLGLGLKVGQGYRLDYSALPSGDFGFQQALSLAMSFGRPRKGAEAPEVQAAAPGIQPAQEGPGEEPRLPRRGKPEPTPVESPTPDLGTFELEARVEARTVSLSWAGPDGGDGLRYDVVMGIVKGATLKKLNELPLAAAAWSGEVGLSGMAYYFRVESIRPDGSPGPMSKVKEVFVP